MSGRVIIKSGLRKKAIRIDSNGNTVDPKTGEIIEQFDSGYTPTSEEIKRAMAKPPIDPYKPGSVDAPTPASPAAPEPADGSPLQRAIAAKVQDAVAKEISKIDIGGMVTKAIEDAFK